MPPNKKKKLEREVLLLKCEFSQCHDTCHGYKDFNAHVRIHVNLMRQQLDDVDKEHHEEEEVTSQCACPWRDCDTVLEFKTDWSKCLRHLFFHAFHTYMKALGDDELKRRKVPMECKLDSSKKNTVPDLPDPFNCQWDECQYVTEDVWDYYRHAESHGKNPSLDDTWSCHWASCQYKTLTTSKLRDHIRSHTQERRLACSHCGTLVCSAIRLEDHQKRQSHGDQMFQCSHCSKQFAAERLLRDHLRKHVNLYACMFCDMTCPTPSALKLHITYRHSSERPYACEHCDQRYKTKYDLANHQITHELNGMLISCPVEDCDFTTKNPSVMFKHHRLVHKDGGRIYGCHICDEQFTTSTEISKHLKQVHALKVPPGHVRFRFAPEEDGIRKLVTVRFECIQNDNVTDTLSLDGSQTLLDDSSIAPTSPASSVSTFL